MTSLDGINGRSIQTLLRGENDSKQSDEFQTIYYCIICPFLFPFYRFVHTLYSLAFLFHFSFINCMAFCLSCTRPPLFAHLSHISIIIWATPHRVFEDCLNVLILSCNRHTMCVKVNKSSDLNVCHVNDMCKVHCLFCWTDFSLPVSTFPCRGRGGVSHLKGAGMLFVSLRGVNFRFWSRLGCSGQLKHHYIYPLRSLLGLQSKRGGQGVHNLPLPVPRFPASRTFLLLCLPTHALYCVSPVIM